MAQSMKRRRVRPQTPVKPWFDFDKRGGDRTLEQQLRGLDNLPQLVRGRSVLDVGCAEGLIAFELIRAGAIAVHGIESQALRVADANRLRGDMACMFEQADANTWRPRRAYHVVMMLSILHKLKRPVDACLKFAECASDAVVIRLPPRFDSHEEIIVLDERSGNRPYNIGQAMTRAGFKLDRQVSGAFSEWIGYYTRT